MWTGEVTSVLIPGSWLQKKRQGEYALPLIPSAVQADIEAVTPW